MKTSVIIPTFNRPENLIRLLESIENSTIDCADFEVIAVNDGSTISYDAINQKQWSFAFKVLRQENQGEAIARNAAVDIAGGEFILFLDDDMQVAPGYLGAMQAAHLASPDQVLIGNMITPIPEQPTPYQKIVLPGLTPQLFGEVSFTSILAGVLGISRSLYEKIGRMQPVPDRERGRWTDIDFAYRAHLNGVIFSRISNAVVYHHDYAVLDLITTCQRYEEVSRLAPALFQMRPGLREYIPMYNDKHPITLHEDAPGLILKKLVRKAVSAKLCLRIMEEIIRFAEPRIPKPFILKPLYWGVLGGYIYQGYRQGLRDVEKCVA